MTPNIRTIFFDLDNTLIDHTHAQRAALGDVYNRYRAVFHHISCDDFIAEYEKVNDKLWTALANTEITIEELRIQSFMLTLQHLYTLTPIVKHDLRDAFGMHPYYRERYETYTRETDGASRVLRSLSGTYSLGIISNGFTDIQNIKIDQLGWRRFFSFVVLSEDVGIMKPHAGIFESAALTAKHSPDELAFVGDHFVNDVAAAKRAGWNAVWYNPSRKEAPDVCADAIISSLDEVSELFLQTN